MVKLSVLDWITFGVLFGIFVWVILKMVGIINTPDWLLYLPLVGAIFAAGSFYYRVIDFGSKVVRLESNLGQFRNVTIEKIHGLELNCARNHGK